jgi:tetratricopeptide (TPR) repeat protein
MSEEENIGKELKESLQRFERELKESDSQFFSLNELIDISDHFFFNQEIKKAHKALLIATKQHPYSVESFIKSAELFLFEKKLRNCWEMINKAKMLESTNEDLLHIQADYLEATGKYQEAINMLLEGLPNVEDKYAVRSHIFSICYYGKLYEEGIQHVKDWIKEESDNHILLFELSQFYMNAGKVDDGIDYFTAFIDADPYNSNAWHELGILYEEKDNMEKAIWAHEYSVLTDNEFVPGHLCLAECYLESGELKKMKEHIDIAIDFRPNSADAYLLLGKYHKERSSFTQANKFFKRSLRLNDAISEPWYELAENYKRLNDLPNAHIYYKKAFELDPQELDHAVNYLKLEYEELGLTAAVELFQIIREYLPKTVEIFHELAIIYCDEKMYEEAAQAILEGFEINANNAITKYLLAGVNFAMGHPKLANGFLLEALSLNADQYPILLRVMPMLANDPEILETIELFRN